jgi:hypothetical protein
MDEETVGDNPESSYSGTVGDLGKEKYGFNPTNPRDSIQNTHQQMIHQGGSYDIANYEINTIVN